MISKYRKTLGLSHSTECSSITNSISLLKYCEKGTIWSLVMCTLSGGKCYSTRWTELYAMPVLSYSYPRTLKGTSRRGCCRLSRLDDDITCLKLSDFKKGQRYG